MLKTNILINFIREKQQLGTAQLIISNPNQILEIYLLNQQKFRLCYQTMPNNPLVSI